MTPHSLKVTPWLQPELEALQTDPTFVAENVVLDVCEQIHAALDAQDLRPADLARRLKKTPSAISQLLSGDQNVSLRRLVEVALALGLTVEPPRLVPHAKPSVEAMEADGVDWEVSTELAVALLGDETEEWAALLGGHVVTVQTVPLHVAALAMDYDYSAVHAFLQNAGAGRLHDHLIVS